ncbi:hypothetical protein EOA79_02535 [Mesorhizobium sp. M1A.F.Ca.IN.020.03.2.1]|uniref:hypothetical protein n=2 Tax=Mesorhizobium TaxID=68287 RepID=UPI000FD391A3|nr:hypothetical protein [Mesorhizobium sp. M1A.F.Ca.IN.020.03.2.1]RUV07985.1 hypothetical protein EOA79_02535 [Mesorhizobium sp. M1A.F.Ca.IN.020.03.2.1]
MGLFQLRRAMHEVELVETDFKPDTLIQLSLLDRSAQKVGETLDRLRAGETDLAQQIATLSEELRQTRIAITAFEAAGAVLDGTKQPAIADDPHTVERQVPRAVSA